MSIRLLVGPAPGNREHVLGFALKELLVIAAVSALSLYVIA